jgi:hypothetical protein
MRRGNPVTIDKELCKKNNNNNNSRILHEQVIVAFGRQDYK